MAHPYAPMGGSYDDRIVGIVVDEFLKQGWVVGTFNFRYATAVASLAGRVIDQYRGASGGKTSWSGKPEVADYQSFAGLFIHYLSYLHPHPPPDAPFVPEQLPISPTGAVQTDPNRYVTPEYNVNAPQSATVLNILGHPSIQDSVKLYVSLLTLCFPA